MTTPAAKERRRENAGVFRSLRVRNYRLYASGQAISLTGTWMQRIAQDWLVLELTDNNAAALGVVIALQFAPISLFGLWGGVLADRYDKRRLLMASQTAMGLQALLLGLLDLTGAVVLWHVFALAAVLGTTRAVETPARQTFAVEMVGRDELPNAVALNSSTFNLARLVGPALAGLMITWVGTGPVFLLNAVSVIAVMGALARMRAAELYRAAPVPRARGQVRDGLRHVRSRVDLVVPMVLVAVVGAFGMNYQFMLAPMAREVFDREAAAYGLLTTTLGLGAICGTLLAARRRHRPRLRFLVGTAFVFGLLVVALGFMPTYALLAVALVPVGVATMSYTTAANSSVQMGVSAAMRGRVMALYLMCFFGGVPIGATLLGLVGEHFGPRVSIVVGGLTVSATAVTVALALARRRGLRPADLTQRLRRWRARTGQSMLSSGTARNTVRAWMGQTVGSSWGSHRSR